tara:strand:- start:2625 stop:3071 length:447 start_codon:yes stop_codon:yes gene_type:complete
VRRDSISDLEDIIRTGMFLTNIHCDFAFDEAVTEAKAMKNDYVVSILYSLKHLDEPLTEEATNSLDEFVAELKKNSEGGTFKSQNAIYTINLLYSYEDCTDRYGYVNPVTYERVLKEVSQKLDVSVEQLNKETAPFLPFLPLPPLPPK